MQVTHPVPVQNCSLLQGIRIYSDKLHNSSFLLGSRFAPSICRSIVSENGRDVLWGKAEEEVEAIIKTHIRRILKKNIPLKNVRLLWEGDETDLDDVNQAPVRRSNIRAIYLFGREKEAISSITGDIKKIFKVSCKWDSSDDVGGYLVCRDISIDDWDRLMVEISIRSLPLIEP